ncbi:hypothetical protein FBR04_19245 [Betaproteobacteria bacterium PRO7]|nr:hypothetical protein [Betaproteobacteria bacterium PRO7]
MGHHHPRKKPVRREHSNPEQDEGSPEAGQPQIEYERQLTSRDQLSAMRALKDLEKIGDKERKRRAERSLELGLEAAKSVQDRRISLFVRGDQPQFAGINTFAHAPYCENIKEVGQYDVAFVGAPLDVGTTYRTGTRFGPQGVRRMLDVDLLPHLGARPLASITLRDVQAVLNAIVDRGAPVQANRVLLVAKRVLRYARMQGHIEVNPIAELTRRDVGGTEGERERALSFDEIATFWHVLAGAVPVKRTVRAFARKNGRTTVAAYERGGLHLEPATRACLQFLLLTGQRVGETLLARWGDIDLDAALWRIPAHNTKTGRPHLVHLPSLAVDVLRAIPGERAADRFVFASSQSAQPSPIERRTVTRALDRLLAGGALPLAHFTPHDLRRTLRSRLGDLGVLPHVAEKILNHRLGGVLQVYDRSEYLSERAAAMSAWDENLRELLADEAGRAALAPAQPEATQGKAARTAVAAAAGPDSHPKRRFE